METGQAVQRSFILGRLGFPVAMASLAVIGIRVWGSRVKVDPGKQPDPELQSRLVRKFDEDSFQWIKPNQDNACKTRVRDRRGAGEKTTSELIWNATVLSRATSHLTSCADLCRPLLASGLPLVLWKAVTARHHLLEFSSRIRAPGVQDQILSPRTPG